MFDSLHILIFSEPVLLWLLLFLQTSLRDGDFNPGNFAVYVSHAWSLFLEGRAFSETILDIPVLSLAKAAILIAAASLVQAPLRVRKIATGTILTLFTLYAAFKWWRVISDPEVIDFPLVWATTFISLFVVHTLTSLFLSLRYALVTPRVSEPSGQITLETNTAPAKSIPWKRLGRLLYPDMGLMIWALINLLINSGTSLLIPDYFGRVVDTVSRGGSDLNRIMLELVIVFVVGAIAGFIRAYYFTLIGYRIVKSLRIQTFNAIIAQEIAYFDESDTGELTTRLANDTQCLQNGLTVNISMLVRFLVQAVGSMIILFTLSWKLTLIMLAIVPVVAIGARFYGDYIGDIQEKFQDKLALTGSIAQEVISQIRIVRSFAKETSESRRYSEAVEETHRVGVQITFGQAVFTGLIGLLPQGVIAIVLYYGGVMVMSGEITGGLLTSFLLYTLTLAMSFSVISGLFGDFMQAIGASQRIFQILDRVPAIPSEGGISLSRFSGRIDFKNVCFTYPARKDAQVLKGFSLSIEPGKVLALVGPSGQGKSTVMSLILRFYDCNSGQILLDQMSDLKLVDLKWYRSVIGYVSQEPVLFSGSIRDNIMYGWQNRNRPPTEDEIVSAAKQANAHDFITLFPDGYATTVGERGLRLSGGQKQRIALARAFLLNPKILLLDEATSALDTESERLVQEAIDRAMVGRTVVVIAHRLSTVVNADKIVVIKDGTVAESGTHKELMELGEQEGSEGVYRQLVLRQMKN